METPVLTPAARQGFFRRLFTWRTARKVLFLFTALITLVALLVAEEDWRGSRAWENYKRDMEAKGEHFDIARLIPPKVPDDENFAMTPFLAPIFNLPPEVLRQPLKLVTNMVDDRTLVEESDEKRGTNIASFLPADVIQPRRFTWQYELAADLSRWAEGFRRTNSATIPAQITDPVQAASIVLDSLKACESTLEELRSSSARPFCRFNIPYEEWPNPQVVSALMEHLSVVKGLYRVFSVHAEAEMVLGRADVALKDINVMFRIDDGMKDEPLLISQLVRIACTTIMLQSVGEGLAEHRWSEAQLQVLQTRLQKTDLLTSTVQALYGERDICSNLKFDQGYMSPRGWNRLEQLNVNRAFQEMVLPRIQLAGREISPGVNHSIDLAFQKIYEGKGFSAFLHHFIMASMMLPAISNVGEKAALAQSGVDMASMACALERCRLSQGQYPETLGALVPRFAAALPHDIINGQPLKYRRTDDGRFILYSVGWNEKDDGGIVATTKASQQEAQLLRARHVAAPPAHQDTQQGDWVWQYPEKP